MPIDPEALESEIAFWRELIRNASRQERPETVLRMELALALAQRKLDECRGQRRQH
ncbi:MAG: hypothetical protein AAGE01_21425 [Pseudomonadota bacterium]